MIIDEVKTGFRVAKGGAQELYGVMPTCAPSPRRWPTAIPSRCWPAARNHAQGGSGVAHGGTYTAHPVSLAAAEKTLEILARDRCAGEARALRHAPAQRHERDPQVARHRAQLRGTSVDEWPVLCAQPPRTYRDWKGSDYTFYDAVAKVLHDERILCEPDSREPWFMSAAHDDSCLKDTLSAFEVAVDTTLNAQGSTRRVPA